MNFRRLVGHEMDLTMGHQRNKRATLEPVLENYMGPPISYTDTPRKPRRGTRSSNAKVAPTPETGKQARGATSRNPLNIFGKLRDRYIKSMNEIAMGGDFSAVAGYHGCVPGQDYPGTMQNEIRERELEALREELAAFRRLQS